MLAPLLVAPADRRDSGTRKDSVAE
jgi:hypothetical protein